MNKKGFTLIELITTFALATVIIILLINVISIIKNIYTQNNIKSTLVIEQSTLSKLMNETFSKGLDYYYSCDDSDYCYNFVFEDGSYYKLVVEENKIKFNEYVYNLGKDIKVVDPTLTRNYVDIDDATNIDNFFNIKIPIISKLYPTRDFGIDLVFKGPEKTNVGNPCTLVSGDKTTAGSLYTCEVKTGTSYNFYVLSQNDDGSTNLILDRNINSDGTLATAAITSGTVYSMDAWYYDYTDNSYGPITAMNFLYNATKDWDNIPNIKMNYEDEGNDGGYGYGNIITTNGITQITRRDGTAVNVLNGEIGYTNLKVRMPYLREVSDYNGSNGYLYEYLDGTSWNHDASTKPKNNISKIYGYWILSSLSGIQGEANHVDCLGIISSKGTDGALGRGFRPVITLRL